MYRIKPNGNYNLVVTDIGISVNAEQSNGIVVEKELIDNSSDAQRLIDSKLLLVETVDSNQQKTNKKVNKKSDKEKAFVVQGKINENPDNIFVKDTPGTKSTKNKVEQVESLTLNGKDEEVAKSSETKSKDVIVSKDEKAGSKEVKEESTSSEKDKKTNKKPAPKKN